MAAAKSRLLEQFSARGIDSQAEELKSAQEADELRTKLMRILHNDIMDFKRTRVETVLACCETLLKCFRNIADHPEESKYRKIKAANPKWAETVETVATSRDFLLAMGWRIEVVEFARSWVYNAPPGSPESKMPSVAAQLLEDAVVQLRHKLSLNKKTDKNAEAAAIRERARLNIQEDRRLKRERDERAQQAARERTQQAELEKQIAVEKQAELEREAAKKMGSSPSTSDKKEL